MCKSRKPRKQDSAPNREVPEEDPSANITVAQAAKCSAIISAAQDGHEEYRRPLDEIRKFLAAASAEGGGDDLRPRAADHWATIDTYDCPPQGKPAKKKISPPLAAFLSVVILLLIVAALICLVAASGMPEDIANLLAGIATVGGLILLAVGDFMEFWMREDMTDGDGKTHKIRENLMTVGHSLALAGGAYLLAAYLISLFSL